MFDQHFFAVKNLKYLGCQIDTYIPVKQQFAQVSISDT